MLEEAPKTPIDKTILLLVAAATSLSGLLTAIATVSKDFADTTHILGGLSQWQIGALTGALLLVAIWSGLKCRRRRSILDKPEALRLDRTNAAHLKGRGEDLEYLLPLVRAERLIFMEGESGAGKSALLRSGLLPKLRTIPELLPILVESLAGEDWEHEPRRFVAGALAGAMSETLTLEQRRKVFPDDVVTPEKMGDGLGQIFPVLGRMPVLLLDQFDDYQNRFLDKFLIQRSWLKPDTLIEGNGFWADIERLLDAGLIHCLIVTRTDTAGGLATVRFRPPATYRVDRLRVQFVAAIIDTLVGSPEANVVRDPERGWTDLVKRLTADLERGETVLPQQLRTVLLGLGTLPHRIMTVAALQRAGGVFGLEVRFIEDCIGRVARLAALSQDRIRAVLLTLVDPLTAPKTLERAAEEISEAVPGIATDRLGIALQELERLEVTRRRGDADSQSQKWLLDHDYLARAVREADRRANRWARDLAEGAQNIHLAGSSWRLWWQGLLPPSVQLGFLADRLRSRFQYGEYRRFAVISLARFAPYLLGFMLLTAVSTLGIQQREARRMEDAVATQLNRLSFDPGVGSQYGLSNDEGAALMKLASTDDRAGLYALHLALTDPSRQAKFLRQPEAMVNALIGTSMLRHDAASALIVSAAVSETASGQYPPDTVRVIVEVAIRLGITGQMPPSWWGAAIEANEDFPHALDALGRGLAPLAEKITPNEAEAVSSALLAAIQANKTFPDRLASLGRDLAPLADKMALDQAKAAIAVFMAAIEANKSSPEELSTLGRGLAPLAGKMSPDQVATVITAFLTAMSLDDIEVNKVSPFVLGILGGGLTALADEMTANQAKTAFLLLLAAIEARPDPMRIYARTGDLAPAPDKTAVQADAVIPAFATLAKKVSADQAMAVTPALVTAIGRDLDYPNTIDVVASGLAPLVDKMTADQTNAAINSLVTAIKMHGLSPSALARLGPTLAPLSDKMTADQANSIITAFVNAIAADANTHIITLDVNQALPHSIDVLGAGLAPLTDEMTTDQAKAVIASLFGNINFEYFPDEVDMLGRGLAPLAHRMTADQARALIPVFLATTEAKKRSALTLSAFWIALAPLADKMTAEQAKEVIPAFLTAMEANKTSVFVVGRLGEGLAPLADRMTADEVHSVIATLLTAIEAHNTSPGVLDVLGHSLASLGDRMTAEQARLVIPAFLAAIEANKTPPYALAALGRGLAPLANKMTAEQADATIAVGLNIIQSIGNGNVVNRYATLIDAADHHLTHNEQVLLILRLLDHPLISGDAREGLLESLSSLAGPQHDFKDRFWDGMAWAQAEATAGRLPGYPPPPLFRE